MKIRSCTGRMRRSEWEKRMSGGIFVIWMIKNSEICAVCVLVVYSMEVKPGGSSGVKERFGCKARRINTGAGKMAVRF